MVSKNEIQNVNQDPIKRRAELIKNMAQKAREDPFGRKIVFDSRGRKITIEGYYYSIIKDAKGYKIVVYRGNTIRFSENKITIRKLSDIDALISLLQKLKKSTTIKAVDLLNKEEGYIEEKEIEDIYL